MHMDAVLTKSLRFLLFHYFTVYIVIKDLRQDFRSPHLCGHRSLGKDFSKFPLEPQLVMQFCRIRSSWR